MSIRRKLSISFVVLSLGFFPITLPTQRVEACVDGTTDTDRDIQSQMGCSRKFIDWQFNIYDMRGWDDWGLEDTCNLDLPYAKVVNSAYLISYGLPRRTHRQDSFIDSLMFHGAIDYETLASAGGGEFHHSIYYGKADASDDSLASFERVVFGKNRIELHCPLFDMRRPDLNNPGTRAMTFMHEGWHAWQARYDIGERDYKGHIKGPAGLCKFADTCDRWYSHDMTEYEFGQMHEHDEGQRPIPKVHSPIQVQVEFGCDLAVFANPWVSNGTMTFARESAAARLGHRFINQPSLAYCGDPRMFMPSPASISGTIYFPDPSYSGQPIVRNGENVCNRIKVTVSAYEPAEAICRDFFGSKWCYMDPEKGKLRVIQAEGNYQRPGDTCQYRINGIDRPLVDVGVSYEPIETKDMAKATWKPADAREITYINANYSTTIRPNVTLRKDLALEVKHPVIVR